MQREFVFCFCMKLQGMHELNTKIWNTVVHILLKVLTFSMQELHLCLNANRLDPGQPPSNSAAGPRSNLFAT